MKAWKLIFLPFALMAFLLALVFGSIAYFFLKIQQDNRNVIKPVQKY